MHSTCRRRMRCVVGHHSAEPSVFTHAQLKLRLKTLLDKKRMMQARNTATPKISASFITLEEGFQQFGTDLSKLQVCSRVLYPLSSYSKPTAIRRDQRYCLLEDLEEGKHEHTPHFARPGADTILVGQNFQSPPTVTSRSSALADRRYSLGPRSSTFPGLSRCSLASTEMLSAIFRTRRRRASWNLVHGPKGTRCSTTRPGHPSTS